MSYIALARKWRPQTFVQLLGQEHLVTALQNSLDNKRIHHAYLFTGTRGVGKTSVARLLAKSLNCEQGISANPCLKCEACISFAEGRFIDLIEIDGASKTKVEDTRELLENVQYAPTVGRFKIYLIDEVHMLSQHSFNALLKTLEEPPEHVKFLLATTDPEKLPITVLSRCLQFNLKHVQEDTLVKHLQNILKEENIQFELSALHLLARAAKGSVRDALSLLDQAIVGCHNGINNNDVQGLLGYTKQNYSQQIIHALINKEPQHLLQTSRDINTEGGLFHHTIDELLSQLHQIAVHQSVPTESKTVDASIVSQAQDLSAEETQLLYQIALKGRDDINLAPTPLIGFEILLLRMYTFTPTRSEAPLQTSNVSTAKPSPENSVKSNNNLQTNKQETINPVKQIITKNTQLDEWHTIVSKLNLRGLAINAAENAQMINYENDVCTLVTDKAHESLFTPSVINNIENSLSNLFAKKTKILLQTGKLPKPSPANIKQQTADENLKSASESLDQDVFFKRLQEEFSAELVKNSIASLKDDA